MGRNRQVFSCYLDPHHMDWLERASKLCRMSKAEILRSLLDHHSAEWLGAEVQRISEEQAAAIAAAAGLTLASKEEE